MDFQNEKEKLTSMSFYVSVMKLENFYLKFTFYQIRYQISYACKIVVLYLPLGHKFDKSQFLFSRFSFLELVKITIASFL